MRSNKNCVVCMSKMREMADEIIGLSPSISHALSDIRAEIRVKLIEINERLSILEEKKELAYLGDDDVAERNRLLSDMDDLSSLKTLSVSKIEAHNLKHRLYKNDQSFREADIEDGDVFEGVNFMQATPHTVITEATGLTFSRCNLTNVEIPDGAFTENCSIQHRSFCSHLNAGLLARKIIHECPDDCEHMVCCQDEMVIEGKVVARNIRRYQDRTEDK